ncbi:MAG: polysaccharide deacetylase family protein [Chloroflexi bacterium]|nr:polysaccharide deacetylase family protein [Chloroflexota bacterium]
MRNILTVDVEAWFNQCGIEDILPISSWDQQPDLIDESVNLTLDLLDEYRARATFFFMGYWAGKKPHVVKKVLERGHEIGCHGFSHQRTYDLGKENFEDDLTRALSILGEVSGKAIRCYRAPEWSMRKDAAWTLDILAKHGISYDSSMMPVAGLGDPGADPLPHSIKTEKSEILEIPPTTIKTIAGKIPVSGGLFFRALPYSLIRARIKSLNKNGYPAVIYIHPWELTPDHPRLRPYTLRGIFHYAMLRKALPRLRKLLSDFEFAGIEDFFKT